MTPMGVSAISILTISFSSVPFAVPRLTPAPLSLLFFLLLLQTSNVLIEGGLAKRFRLQRTEFIRLLDTGPDRLPGVSNQNGRVQMLQHRAEIVNGMTVSILSFAAIIFFALSDLVDSVIIDVLERLLAKVSSTRIHPHETHKFFEWGRSGHLKALTLVPC
jgi:hypothetical protein